MFKNFNPLSRQPRNKESNSTREVANKDADLLQAIQDGLEKSVAKDDNDVKSEFDAERKTD